MYKNLQRDRYLIYVDKAETALNDGSCQRACDKERDFNCRSFSFLSPVRKKSFFYSLSNLFPCRELGAIKSHLHESYHHRDPYNSCVIYADYDYDFDYCRLPVLHRQAQVCACSVETQLRTLDQMLSSPSWEPSIQSVNVIHEGFQVEIMSVALGIAGHIHQ